MLRILITGSRDWNQRIRIMDALNRAARGHSAADITVVHGGAQGADLIADDISRGWHWNVEPHPVSAAEWEARPKRAGFDRNQLMVDLGADICLAFINPCRKPSCAGKEPHDSHGVTDCVSRAERARIPVRPYRR